MREGQPPTRDGVDRLPAPLEKGEALGVSPFLIGVICCEKCVILLGHAIASWRAGVLTKDGRPPACALPGLLPAA